MTGTITTLAAYAYDGNLLEFIKLTAAKLPDSQIIEVVAQDTAYVGGQAVIGDNIPA